VTSRCKLQSFFVSKPGLLLALMDLLVLKVWNLMEMAPSTRRASQFWEIPCLCKDTDEDTYMRWGFSHCCTAEIESVLLGPTFSYHGPSIKGMPCCMCLQAVGLYVMIKNATSLVAKNCLLPKLCLEYIFANFLMFRTPWGGVLILLAFLFNRHVITVYFSQLPFVENMCCIYVFFSCPMLYRVRNVWP